MTRSEGTSGVRSGKTRRPSTIPLVALLLPLLALLLSVGCGSGEPLKASQTPLKGGVLRLPGLPETLDPARFLFVDEGWVDHCLFETLFAYAPGVHVVTKTGANQEFTLPKEGLQLEPGLAAAMPEVSKDGKVYTIRLRSDSRFAPPVDRAVTATDVQYSFERMLREPAAWVTFFFSSIEGVDDFIAGKGQHVRGFTVVDPHTIELRLSRPDPTILNAFALTDMSVVPKEWVEKWGKKFGQNPLGSGPFMFVSWQQAGKLVLKRNPNYHDAAHVWLDGVEFVPYRWTVADLMRVQRGDLDVCFLDQPSWIKVRSDPKWKLYLDEQLMVDAYIVTLNAQMEPLDDVRVRQAFNWAVDRERLARIAGCDPSWQILPEGMPGHIEGAKFYGFDPDKAKQLLAEAGYPDGVEVTLKYPSDIDFARQMAQALQQDLKKSGIEVKLEMVPKMTYTTALSTPGTIAMGLAEYSMDFPDPYDWVRMLFSKDAAVKGGTNNSFWWDQKVEDMIADAQFTLDLEKRIAKFSEVQRAISEGAPIVPVWQLLSANLTSPAVGGYYTHPVYILDPEHYWRLPGGE